MKKLILTVMLTILTLTAGCGHKTRLSPPEPRRLERVTSITAELKCGEVVLNWKPVYFDNRGNPLEASASYLILRRRGAPLAPPLTDPETSIEDTETEDSPDTNLMEEPISPDTEENPLEAQDIPAVEYDFSMIDWVKGTEKTLTDPDWMDEIITWTDTGFESGPVWTPQKKQFRPPRDFSPENTEPGEGLIGASTMYYMIIAIGPDRTTSEPSETISIPWIYIPSQPVDLTSEITADSIDLAWSAPESDCLGTVTEPSTRFEIHRREVVEGETSEFDLLNTVETPEYTDKTISKDVVYEYKTRAHLAELGVFGEFSDALTVDTTDRFPPAVPENLTGATSILGIHLNWRQVTDVDLAGYRLYRRDTDSEKFTAINPDTLIVTNTYTDETTERGKTYEYQVTAVDESKQENESEAGNVWSVTIK